MVLACPQLLESSKLAQVRLARISCLVCGSDADRELLVVNGFRIARCYQCGFVFVNPRPTREALAELYSSREGNIYFDERYEPEEFEAPVLQFVLRRVMRYAKSGSVLEFGCGRGDLLKRAAIKGFSCVGCDFFSDDVPSSPDEKIRFCNAPLSEAGIATGSIDVAIARNVLEHLYDPRDELAEISRIVKQDGIFYVKVPSVSFEYGVACRAVFGKSQDLAPPYHLNHFSRTSLRRLLIHAGFMPLSWHLEPPSMQADMRNNLIRKIGYYGFRGLSLMSFKMLPVPTLGCIARRR